MVVGRVISRLMFLFLIWLMSETWGLVVVFVVVVGCWQAMVGSLNVVVGGRVGEERSRVRKIAWGVIKERVRLKFGVDDYILAEMR